MATKARTIIDQAKARSTYNDADAIFLDSEAIVRIDLRLSELFSFVNQEATPQEAYFGTELLVAPAAGAWTRPANADVVLAVYGGGGTFPLGSKITLAPYDDRLAEVAPAIYPVGSVYKSVGRTGDPVATTPGGNSLLVFYARFPAALDPTKPADHADNTLDAAWPERFNNLLVVDFALYLMSKDNRFTVEGGAEALMKEQETTLVLLQQHVARANRAMRSRFGQRRRLAQVHGP